MGDADLDRFVSAQQGSYDGAFEEIRRGRKSGHWMWFVFPQIAGLGRSPTAQHYAIADLDEARAYLAHPVLGGRLRECAHAVADSDAATAQAIFGGVDTMKLRSSMTLFEAAAGAGSNDAGVFGGVLDRYFGGARDATTLGLL